MNRIARSFLFALCFSSLSAYGFNAPGVSMEGLHAAADIVALAEVMDTRTMKETNEFGDKLILTHAKLRIIENRKGKFREAHPEIVLEGGTLGGITLKVSDQPDVEEGEELLVYLRESSGRYFPVSRGEGIFKLRKGELIPEYEKSGAKWALPEVKYFVNPKTKDMPADVALKAIVKAARNWSEQSRARISLKLGGVIGGGTVKSDQRSEIFFRDARYFWNSSVLAITYWWTDRSGNTLDADMVIWDKPHKFFGGSAGCNQGGIYLEDLVTHEFGHLLGLNHSPVKGATMGATIPRCDTTFRSLSSDDIAGIEAVYPSGP